MSHATIRKSFLVAGLFAVVVQAGAAAAAEAHRHFPAVGAAMDAIVSVLGDHRGERAVEPAG